MTNNHVIEDGGEIIIRYGNEGPRIPVRSYASSAVYDIAVLIIETEEELEFHLIELMKILEQNLKLKKDRMFMQLELPKILINTIM
jgi:S1-C subfamily serine protease